MDIASHALAGASVGNYFGNSLAGAVIAIIPDIVLGIKRKEFPNKLYNLTHSLLGIFFISLFLYLVLNTFSVFDSNGFLAIYLCLLSHIVLDLGTHGGDWAPPLFYPVVSKRFMPQQEWEFFNKSWFVGLLTTLLWCLLWFQLDRMKGM